MSRFEFKLPDIGEGMAEAELVEWLVNVGDAVKEDQAVAAVLTDKATVELESPVAGTVTERVGEIGEAIRVGAMLLAIETEGGAAIDEKREVEPARAAAAPPPAPAPALAPAPVPAPVSPPPPPPQGKVLATPVVRRRAHDLGVDLSRVPHEGARVKNADLDAFLIASQPVEPSVARHAMPLAMEDKEIPVTGMRRIIAQRMEEAKRHIPHFTYVEEVDMTEFERLRAELNSSGQGVKLTMLPLLIAAICRSLPEFPQLNAHYYDDNQIVRRFGSVHMGMAAQTDAGLMVPVIHEAEKMDIWQLAAEIGQLADQARKGTIDREKLRGSTLTVTSLGKLGGIAATPIINRPEVCIIGPNKIVERPMWIDGAVVPRKMMNLSISCDHRVVDGYDAAAFVQALKRRLETPALIFVNG